METVQRANEAIKFCDYKHQCIIFIFWPAVLRHLASVARAARLPLLIVCILPILILIILKTEDWYQMSFSQRSQSKSGCLQQQWPHLPVPEKRLSGVQVISVSLVSSTAPKALFKNPSLPTKQSARPTVFSHPLWARRPSLPQYLWQQPTWRRRNNQSWKTCPFLDNYHRETKNMTRQFKKSMYQNARRRLMISCMATFSSQSFQIRTSL